MSGTNFYMNLAFVIGSFLVPWALLVFPLIALSMQVISSGVVEITPQQNT
jgi:hypothetical protein